MKKFLTMVVALILIFCVCSSCISKKEEAEYKAKVKQELDSIPLEETGYKLVETNYSDNERVQKYKNELTIDGHIYKFSSDYNNNFITDEAYFYITVDDKKEDYKKIYLSKYGDAFNYYTHFYGCYYFDGQIFLVKDKRVGTMFGRQLEYYLPPILFLYDYEKNTIKYCGYFEEWFNYRVFDAAEKYFKIVKT